MEPYARRVLSEQAALDEKIESLTRFVSTPTFHGLAGTDRSLLTLQKSVMTTYSLILGMRLDRLESHGQDKAVAVAAARL